MKVLMQHFSTIGRGVERGWRMLALCIALLFLYAPSAFTQQNEKLSAQEQKFFGHLLEVKGDYEMMKSIHRYWVQETLRLRAMRRFEFASTGYQESVLKVTIPTSMLFAQSDTVLAASADGNLRPFLHLLYGENAMATLVVACHSDNNGSNEYLMRQTTARAHAVHRWFLKQRVPSANVRSYGLGGNSPRTKNETLEQRRQNRRVTLFFVPNKQMLKQAKKGKL